MKRTGFTHKNKTAHQKAIHSLDGALSKLIRSIFFCCATCSQYHDEYDCGHFVKRERMITRFHPWNVYAQGLKENRFEGGKEWEFGQGIDRRWGKGSAAFLKKLARENCQWTTNELEQLKCAAKLSWRAYQQVYRELRPNHFPT